MKIVEHSREITLRREDIGLARERTENASLVEREEQRRGTIYILPASRRFELHPESGGEALRGVIAPECLQLLTGGGTEVRAGLIGTVVTVQLRRRQIQGLGRESSTGYTLLSVGENPPRPFLGGSLTWAG